VWDGRIRPPGAERAVMCTPRSGPPRYRAGNRLAAAPRGTVSTFSDNDISAYSGRTRPGFEKAPGRK